MSMQLENKNLIGINSIGRIGKLLLWNQLIEKHFDGAVINVGRTVGQKLEDVIQSIETDTTYGSLYHFLFGHQGKKKCFEVLDYENALISFDGFLIKFLMNERNPLHINWKKENVHIVVDCTGQFTDPTLKADNSKGSLRGHLEGGAEKVILSAPFKIKDKTLKTPDDCIMMVYGINHLSYNPAIHQIISAASCTTTCLSHMMKPLLEHEETSKILTASMSTIHAATNTQSVLDTTPKAGTNDLRKNRSVFNNVIISTTGAAKALEVVIPEIQSIGFMADSVRIPTNSVSLIILNLTFSSGLNSNGEPVINKKLINTIYKQASEGSQKDLLHFSDNQNTSVDFLGFKAAAVIEGYETHTRTGFLPLKAEVLKQFDIHHTKDINLPVTHAKIFGWYDNEFGSYVNCLSRLAVYIDKKC
ncbi:MAG: glyceraldehyde 3-phosphate dehydrogenase NAD-binding domain-containing protein [Bacteroidales bacterium]|nr:glyceraldehyde 3-phosphate dehydrogenase NAD-binding domain-containing protein [Bacteroidales bacterium]